MTDPTRLSPAEMLAMLERSEAEAAAGDTVPLAPVMQRLRDSIERLEAKTVSRRKAAPRR